MSGKPLVLKARYEELLRALNERDKKMKKRSNMEQKLRLEIKRKNHLLFLWEVKKNFRLLKSAFGHVRFLQKKPSGGRPRCVCFLCFVAVSLVHSPVYIYLNDSFLLLICLVYSVQFLVPTI